MELQKPRRVCPDHVHMLLEIPPKMSVSSFMGFLKKRWSNIKYKYRNGEFRSKGYYVDTAGKNAHIIAEFIKNQMKEDAVSDQLTLDLSDPFTDSK